MVGQAQSQNEEEYQPEPELFARFLLGRVSDRQVEEEYGEDGMEGVDLQGGSHLPEDGGPAEQESGGSCRQPLELFTQNKLRPFLIFAGL